MFRTLSTILGPAIFIGAYVAPMLSAAADLAQVAHAVAGRVEARTSPDAMLESLRSGGAMRETLRNLPFHASQAREFMRAGMAELEFAVRDGESLGPLFQEQLRMHRDMMNTISGFLRQDEHGLSR